MRNGIGITSIQLWIFGGMARMDREADSPGTELKVALAGPLVTLAIVLVLTLGGIAVAGTGEFEDAAVLESQLPASPGWWRWSPGWRRSTSCVLVFNLLPAFPMDGGRVARAIAWWQTGDRTAATRFAANLGRALRLPLHRRRSLHGRHRAIFGSSAASGWP